MVHDPRHFSQLESKRRLIGFFVDVKEEYKSLSDFCILVRQQIILSQVKGEGQLLPNHQHRAYIGYQLRHGAVH